VDYAAPELAVIGGSGFYRYLEDTRSVTVKTPWGPPSAPLTLGWLQGKPVAFLPRHGADHELPPHLVNYRANLWALREVGATRVVGSCAVGSLRADLRPGDLMVLDQLVDRTRGRADTFVEGEPVVHIQFAFPYCPALSGALRAAGADAGSTTVHATGTVVVVQGPRFSTRAESRWFRAGGADVVNMTQYPEVALARELGLCYAGAAMITDYDAGLAEDPSMAPVDMAQVFEVLKRNVGSVQQLLAALVPRLDALGPCACAASRAR
jgi:5'-methylthioadenosine phosphorylase